MSAADSHNDNAFNNLIKEIIQDLFSYNANRRKHIFEYYFFKDAELTSPLLSTIGINNIQYVYTVWQTLNRREPTVDNVVFNGQTAVIHLTHHLSPTLLPKFIQLDIPAITTLHFRETESDSGLLKIYKQEDSWTLEGLIHSIPLISFWYDHVLRVVMGKLVTTTGDILYSAIHHAKTITTQSRNIQQDLINEKQPISDDDRYKHRGQEYYYVQEDEDYAITPIKETNKGGLPVSDHISLLEEPYEYDYHN